MEVGKGASEDFVTVVSVGTHPPPPAPTPTLPPTSAPTPENFVTVLSIGADNNPNDDHHQQAPPAPVSPTNNPIPPGSEGYLEEEVQVFRLPGERLGFGLKFEGGNKTSERVRRLFVQSCAEQSPASRAQCSWGTLGEGDEVLAIDGVAVTHMTRLDCVRRLKESQLVIRLTVRCRGALRPEVVSAERKASPEKSKTPPELPTAPPPVPPRKLRQPRGSADGEANPSPAKKPWDSSRSQSLSQNDSPASSRNGSHSNSQNCSENSSPSSQSSNRPSLTSKSTTYESCESSPKSGSTSAGGSSPKGSPKQHSPDLSKLKQDPPEAMVYLDARSQCGSTHGSTSDDTGSSLSTVVDRFSTSTSDRVSTVSTVSTVSSASTTSAASEQPGELSRSGGGDQESAERDRDVQVSRSICPFDRFERDFASTPPDYLLRRLASSEAVTHVESRGEVERITAVVAPNTVLIEETITFQPPLSFQDAPLSYGHEARPDLFYTDLAADSTTHFRPIKDDAELVGRVNGHEHQHHFHHLSAIATSSATSLPNPEHEQLAPHHSASAPIVPSTPSSSPSHSPTPFSASPPPLPARNHVNRISVNQTALTVPGYQTPNEPTPRSLLPDAPLNAEHTEPHQEEPPPLSPPKPLPRKDLKLRRKRPPPPPPPPTAPSTHSAQNPPNQPPAVPLVAPRRELKQDSKEKTSPLRPTELKDGEVKSSPASPINSALVDDRERIAAPPPERTKPLDESNSCMHSQPGSEDAEDCEHMTNKVFEIIEIRTAKAMSPQRSNLIPCERIAAKDSSEKKDRKPEEASFEQEDTIRVEVPVQGANNPRSKPKIMPRNLAVSTEREVEDSEDPCWSREERRAEKQVVPGENGKEEEDDGEEEYHGRTEESGKFKESGEATRGESNEDSLEEDETSDESEDGDYYWQSNLATIGEEEETNSLEYTHANEQQLAESKVTPLDTLDLLGASLPAKDALDRDEGHDVVDESAPIRAFTELPSNKLNSETVNGRMENCGGGGQRLPPDGDEFPAEYQEFGKVAAENSSADKASIVAAIGVGVGVDAIPTEEQQYRFIAVNNSAAGSMTMTMTMTAERNAGSAANAAFPRDKLPPFPEKERLELLAIESNLITSRTRSIVLPESRVNLVPPASILDTCQELKPRQTSSPSKGTLTSVESLYISDQLAKTNSVPLMTYSSYADSQSNGNLEISEKKIEITGYQKEPSFHQPPLHREKDAFNETPPPLPLTGPPKMEASAKSGPGLEQSPRKFSLNGDLRRQDDKSERSVRDKIAMFSSQSNLDAPLFPSTIAPTSNTASPKRLSKYKSSEDVCASDDKTSTSGQREKTLFFAERTQSSFDLTDSSRCLPVSADSPKYTQLRSTALSQPTGSPHVKMPLPPLIPQKPSANSIPPSPSSPSKIYSWSTQSDSSQESANTLSPNALASLKAAQGSSGLARATSFSGTTPHGVSATSELSSPTAAQIARTNSLASTFRRPAEDVRKTSLNQLIEQRRRSISKLRGLVIPEKEAIPIDQPIVDLPEIKSRDIILTHQLPRSNLQDKWGSQNSLASNASASSGTAKVTTTFKMAAPQINSKYSPAFKRKTLTVYGNSTSASAVNASEKPKYSPPSPVNTGSVTAVTTTKTTASVIATTLTSTSSGSSSSSTSTSTSTSTSSSLTSPPHTTFTTEAPKSLESICSPTRSDYSFDFVSASNSPEGLRSKGRIVQRKSRLDYDDSDNDSAVSSSQSSISRGFSPPMSPVPSERSTISSERSYLSTEMTYPRRCLIVDSSPGRTNPTMPLGPKPNINGKMYLTERSALCSSSTSSASSTSSTNSTGGSSTNSRSPQSVEANSRNSQIPQRQPVRRSNSTDTNCSTSSTLTSGSQASGESLSRRVLKPQSVEAINRKNILASARCRSGKELNGSPLIQRKLMEDGTRYVVTESELALTSRNDAYGTASVESSEQNIKMAYIEVTDPFADDEESFNKASEDDCEPQLPPRRSIPQPAARPPKSEMLEASNDLRMWVRAEAKALESKSKLDHRNMQDFTEDDAPLILSPRGRNADVRAVRQEARKEGKLTETHRNSSSKNSDDHTDDLLTILTTKSRSRSAIHVDDGSFGRSKSQMSLEDILCGKAGPKLARTHSAEESGKESEKNGMGNKYWTVTESRCEEKTFVSKIPTYGRAERRLAPAAEDSQSELAERTKSAVSKIPTTGRTLTRRSASVTDMKKALDEKSEPTSSTANERTATSPPSHSRFPSLDSSVDNAVEENGINSLTRSHLPHLDRCMDPRTDGNLSANPDVERYCGEQFGSISSLASSTSLISQQELAQLVEEANLEDIRSAQEVIVVLLHKEKPTGSVGITLAGGADCEVKEITVHRVLAHSVADKDGRVQRGDRILSINGRSTRGLTHRESLAVLKQPRSEVVLVVSRARPEEGCKLRSRTTSVETIIEGFETNGVPEDIAWGPPSVIAVYKDGAGLGFSLEGGRDSPLGDRALVIKKIFTGGAAEKTGALKAGDQLLEVNGNDVTRMSRIEAWSFMKKLHDGEVNLLVRHPATKSS